METILLVEDEEPVLQVVRNLLVLNRYQVIEAHDGYQALAICKDYSDAIDLMITDVIMPQMNGIEVAKEILAVNPHQRIIFASAYTKDTVIDSIKNLKQSMMESVQKPFEIKRLVDLIEDKMVYQELRRLNIDIDIIKAVKPTHEEISDLLERLQGAHGCKSDERE